MVSVMSRCSLERCWKEYWKNPSTFWGTLSIEQALLTLEEEILPAPSIDVLASILFKCRKQRARSHTLRLHMYMCKNNIEAHSSLGNHVVATLVDVGSIHDARQIFDGLEYRNDMSWHSLITGYIKHGKPQLALCMYTKMQENDRVHLTGRTFVALLKACLMLQDLDWGHEIHAEVARLGLLERDPFLGSTLVNLYTKCGLIVEAKEVFDKLTNRDVVSWNTLLTGYVSHGLAEETLDCFQQMKLQGIHPNAVTFICSLKACVMVGSTQKGTEIHEEVERKGLLESDHLLGSTLVDTYAKFGWLIKAQEVFDGLPVRNVVSWTALIAGYADHQCGQAALISYEAMQVEGVLPNAITYTCLLKACGGVRAKAKGQRIHCDVARMTLLESNINLGNALVDMYAKCSLFTAAREVFDKLVYQDVISWNTLITGYVDQGQVEEALGCFEQMRLKGVSPNVVTFVCSLKACASIGAINTGQDIHAEIQRKGLSEEAIVGNALVDMYAKCGLLAEAEQIFDELPFQDIVSWNAVLMGFSEHLHGDKALKLFEQMQNVGISPDAITFICSLKACGSIRAKEKGEQLYAQMEKMGLLEGNPMIGNTLVDMYAKCGSLTTSQYVFDKISVRYTVAWNALISGYAHHGHGEKALGIFKQMQLENVPPDVVTFVSSLKACGSIGAINKGKELHAEIARQGLLEQDLALGNTLVDIYAKCSSFATALETFDRLPFQDVVSWNVLIAGYAEQGYSEDALNHFKQMRLSGVSPDDVTFVSCLKACGDIGALKEGQELHNEIERKGLVKTDLVGSLLMDMYAKCGLLMDAQHLFDTFPVQHLCLWNVLIAGYLEQGQNEIALESFKIMQVRGVFPDVITYFYCLKACGNLGATVNGEELHIEIVKKGLMEKDFVLGNTLIDMYVKCGLLAVAQNMFDKLPCQNVGSWNSLLLGYDELGESDGIFDVFHRMLGEGLKPDSITFVIVLNACTRRGLFQKARKYFESMSKDYGIIATPDHYTCMIDLLGRTGQLGKAMVSIRELPCSSDLAMWHTLLGACKRWGNLELARHAFKQALCWNNEDAAACILLSNICADASMQREANKNESLTVKEEAWEMSRHCWGIKTHGSEHSSLLGGIRAYESQSVDLMLDGVLIRNKCMLPQSNFDDAKRDASCT